MKGIFSLLRPLQWIKNLFVFLPMFFSGQLFNTNVWLASILSFVTFCIASSGVYCLNDAMDAKTDAMHPVKRNRPIPKGEVSRTTAFILAGFLLTLSVVILVFSPLSPSYSDSLLPVNEEYIMRYLAGIGVLVAYILFNIGYSLGLKHIPILDTMIVAIGFVLRVALGGLESGIPLSPWIVGMVFLLALFLVFAKRRDDLVIARNGGGNVRKSTMGYNLQFLNQVLGILVAIIMVGYMMYCLSPLSHPSHNSPYLYLTSIFVLGALLRYLQIALVKEDSGSPTRAILRDPFLLTCIALWGFSYLFILYL